MGKSVTECSPCRPYGYASSSEMLAPVVDAFVLECGARDARSDDIVLGMPSSLIVTVSVMDRKTRYRPSLRAKNFKYGSVASISASVAAKSGQ